MIFNRKFLKRNNVFNYLLSIIILNQANLFFTLSITTIFSTETKREKAPKINKRLQNFLSFLEERKTKGRKKERKNENSSANSLHDEALSRI